MTKRKSEAERENDARNRAAMKEWTKKLGRKPTPEDMQQRAMIAATPAQREHEKKKFERGKKAGNAWAAESGRSIVAVEAVVNFWVRPPDCSEEVWAELEDKMVQEIGDDEEFEALQDKDDVYIDGWYAGVLAAHEVM
jgi:hypothetical protein